MTKDGKWILTASKVDPIINTNVLGQTDKVMEYGSD